MKTKILALVVASWATSCGPPTFFDLDCSRLDGLFWYQSDGLFVTYEVERDQVLPWLSLPPAAAQFYPPDLHAEAGAIRQERVGVEAWKEGPVRLSLFNERGTQEIAGCDVEFRGRFVKEPQEEP